MDKWFKGRISRNNFQNAIGLYILIGILVGLSQIFVGDFFITAYLVLAIASIPIILGLNIRRAHDLGISGFITLLFFVPVANFLLSLYLIFAKGEEKDNKYGKFSVEKQTFANIFFNQ